MLGKPAPKPCVFVGASRRELQASAGGCAGEFGHASTKRNVAANRTPAKALKGFGGRGVLEVIEDFDGNTYRAVYTVRFAGVVYVLRAFQKKSKAGIATQKSEIETIKMRLRAAEADYKARFKTGGSEAMKKRRIKVEVGSGNIFADLGLPDAEELLLKAQIVVTLRRLIKARNLTQTEAAKRIGIGQPDLSNVLRGRFRGYSTERLMRMLTAFDQDVEITVRPRRGKSKEGGRISSMPRRREERHRRGRQQADHQVRQGGRKARGG